MMPSATGSISTPTAPSPTELVEQALFVSVTVVQQAADFLSKVKDDSQLTFESKAIPGGTIGKHIRHAYAHYDLLLKAISESPEAPYTLSYDVRVRNTPMETSTSTARQELLTLVEQLRTIVPNAPFDSAITLHAVTPFPATMQTTFGRELWFASLHAIHHWSMVKVIASEQGIETDSSFGVAPSTLTYRGHEGQFSSQDPRAKI